MLLQKLVEYAEQRMKLPPVLYNEAPVRYVIDLDGQGRLASSTPVDTAGSDRRSAHAWQRAPTGVWMVHSTQMGSPHLPQRSTVSRLGCLAQCRISDCWISGKFGTAAMDRSRDRARHGPLIGEEGDGGLPRSRRGTGMKRRCH